MSDELSNMNVPNSMSIFTSLLSFGTNNVCFCCKNPSQPTHAWVNHGIFWCEECAKEMENQPNMNVKSISQTDGWTENQIKTLSYGGNARFDEFLGPYLVALEKDKFGLNVFNLQAAEFYCVRLSAFTQTGYFSDPPPSLEEGTKLRDNVDLLNLEAPHPRIADEEQDIGNGRPMKIEDENPDLMDKLDNNLKELWETTGDIFQEHTQKIWQSTSGIRDKTKAAYDVTSHFTEETWDKTKTNTVEIWDKTGDFFNGIKQKTTQIFKENPEENKDEGI